MRRFASKLALLGVLLYTAMVPGHVVSQATAFTGDHDSQPSVSMSCHEGMAAMPSASTPDAHHAHDAQASDTQESGGSDAPKSHCPFCDGYAAFMVTLTAATADCAIDAERRHVVQWAAAERAHQQIARRTQNRGPPVLL